MPEPGPRQAGTSFLGREGLLKALGIAGLEQRHASSRLGANRTRGDSGGSVSAMEHDLAVDRVEDDRLASTRLLGAEVFFGFLDAEGQTRGGSIRGSRSRGSSCITRA